MKHHNARKSICQCFCYNYPGINKIMVKVYKGWMELEKDLGKTHENEKKRKK